MLELIELVSQFSAAVFKK